ncbi:Alpha/Beta hydrolase protein [Thermothelomyces heterothallicus CBS 202.75]|uniref:Alpha/Beta hydrolase protein n=1 Tax=Thermothelomyces heterothallicus CBS 202.75 TaxID=1149848 RepID=UPI003743D803
MATVQAARLQRSRSHVLPGQLHVTELFFEVPKNHARPDAGSLTLFGRRVRRHERPTVPLSASDLASKEKLPYIVYLQGGPGFGNREPQNMPLTQVALSRGYQVLYLDYRGTGLSTPINADSVLAQGDPPQQAEYLKLFRANSIVRDLEAVRLCLTQDFDEERKAWSLFGQSFGGFVALTYLSKYPRGLREVFITGGLAPVKRTADDVYRATYRKLMERNAAYYRKYPEDMVTVRSLAEYIQDRGGIPLPSGGKLTVQLFLTLGLAFGSHGGLDDIHSLVLRLGADIEQFGFFTRASLAAFESHIPYDNNPIYAILHEAIYNTKQRGSSPSNWAADRIGRELQPFSWLADPANFLKSTPSHKPLYFSGEMVYPFYFEGTTGPELARMAAAADILAKTEEWDEDLYDEDQLRRNQVPVYAISYVDDMYVDFELARETAALVRGIKVHETNGWYHDAVRSKSEEVFAALFKLRDDNID